MTEIYQRWLEDSSARALLEGYGADKLNPFQQVAFEILVVNVGISISPRKYGILVRIVAEAISQPNELAKALISDFKAVVRDRERPIWSTDPIAYLGDTS